MLKALDRSRGGRSAAMQPAATHRLSGRHHDRTAARGAASRRDRRNRRILQLRHQRSDSDHFRPVARRCRLVPRRLSARKAFSSTIRSSRIDLEGVGELVQIAVETRPRDRGRTSKLGICGEHGGDPASIASARRKGSITCPVRPIACRSPGWPPRRRRYRRIGRRRRLNS